MLHGPLVPRLLAFAIPLIFSGMLQQSFNAVDVAVVGRFSTSQALAAVGSNGPLVNILVNLFIGVSIGANVVIANYIGRRNERGIKKAIATTATLSVVSGFALLAIGQVFSRSILEWMDTPADVIELATAYLSVYFLGMPFMMVYNFGSAILRSMGDTRRPLYALMISAAVNVGLDLLFTGAMDMGVNGVAIATVCSNAINAGCIVWWLMREEEPFCLHVKELKVSLSELKKMLQIGLPAGMQGMIFSGANLFIQAAINSFGSNAMAGSSSALTFEAYCYFIVAAFAQAATAFMSQNYGAGKPDRVKKSYFISLAYSFGVGLVLGGSLFVFGRSFLALFTTEAAVIDAGMKRVQVMGLAYCISAFMDCTIAASRGLGKTVIPTIIVVLGSCVFRVIWVYTLFAHFCRIVLRGDFSDIVTRWHPMGR